MGYLTSSVKHITPRIVRTDGLYRIRRESGRDTALQLRQSRHLRHHRRMRQKAWANARLRYLLETVADLDQHRFTPFLLKKRHAYRQTMMLPAGTVIDGFARGRYTHYCFRCSHITK